MHYTGRCAFATPLSLSLSLFYLLPLIIIIELFTNLMPEDVPINTKKVLVKFVKFALDIQP